MKKKIKLFAYNDMGNIIFSLVENPIYAKSRLLEWDMEKEIEVPDEPNILQGFEPEKICGLTFTQLLELKAFYLKHNEKLPNE